MGHRVGQKPGVFFIKTQPTLGSCCELGCRDDTNAWRKSTKEADNTQFYCNLESKNLSMHWRHHGPNSRQKSSAEPR